VVWSARVHQCPSVGGPIADEHRPKSELYSRKASVIGFLRWSERPLIVLLGHPFVWIGGLCGQGMDCLFGNSPF